jgi:hypothetical protein
MALFGPHALTDLSPQCAPKRTSKIAANTAPQGETNDRAFGATLCTLFNRKCTP